LRASPTSRRDNVATLRHDDQAVSELVHQRATHRVAGQLDAIGITVDEKGLVAKIVVQVFDSSDPSAGPLPKSIPDCYKSSPLRDG
jgi:hypothetical protein